MPGNLVRGVVFATAFAIALPPPAFAQAPVPAPVPTPAPAPQSGAALFNVEQLDALLAPIALYPDELLTQILMAATFPLQVVAASRWLARNDNKSLKGDALVKALESQNWDPSIKSLVPFPQVLALLNENLEWTQQLGYAVANQQAAVLDSIQRLRRQAQKFGSLKTTEQQKVVIEKETVIIEPANPETVYVPMYKPAEVYGEWPYPSYPPAYLPPPAAYYPPGYAFGAGLAFAAGVAIVGGLWGWARPGWGYGNVTVNPLRYNNINVNRTRISSDTWRPPAAGGPGGLPGRPPGGPAGAPARPRQLPANAIGRPSVRVPGNAVNRPQIPSPGQRSGVGQRPSAGQIPAGGARPGMGQRPSAGQLPAGGQRPTAGQGGFGVGQRPVAGQGSGGSQRFRGGPASAMQRPGAFGGMGDGGRAAQFSARGAQSRSFQQSATSRGGFQHGGGSFQRGGGGGFRGGGRR